MRILWNIVIAGLLAILFNIIMATCFVSPQLVAQVIAK